METNLPKSNNSKKSQPNAYLKFSALGMQMAATIFLFVYAGVKLDEWLKLKFPAFTLLLTLMGLGGSLYYMIKQLTDTK